MKYLLGLRQLPFEQSPKQIIYVESIYHEKVNRYIQDNYDQITLHFKSRGYEFCYIPYLAKELTVSASLRYYAPFSPLDFKPDVNLKSDFILNWMVNPEKRSCIKPSLLYYHPYRHLSSYKDADCLYMGLTLTDIEYDKTNNFSNILDEIHKVILYYDSIIPELRFQLIDKEEADLFYNSLSETKRTRLKLLEEIATEFRQEGVKCAMLDYFTHGQPKVNPMVITKDYKIIISGKEIKIAAKSKALYLLFLNHRNRITYKELEYYIDELLDIYRLLKKRDVLTEKMMKSIEKIAKERDETSWHVNYIRKKFNALFENQISQNYTIEGEQNEERGIRLSRDLVSWECKMPKPMKPVIRIHKKW